jgi:glycosyltransferase involved in cell wall biosynthesis
VVLLSVTIITKDESENIERALKSVAFADEIVVVDSGSADDTCELARRYTDKVLTHDWEGHVKQKQFAVDQAEHDWILSIDADEEVSASLAEKIKGVLSDSPKADAYQVNRRSYYLGKWIEHSGWYPDRRIRLFDRTKARWGGTDPHDWVVCDGTVARLDADLLHYPYRDLSHHLSVINSYTTIMAERAYENGRRATLLDVLFRPPFAFIKKLLVKAAFLDGYPGLVVAVTSAVSVFFKYVKLRDLAAREKRV